MRAVLFGAFKEIRERILQLRYLFTADPCQQFRLDAGCNQQRVLHELVSVGGKARFRRQMVPTGALLIGVSSWKTQIP